MKNKIFLISSLMFFVFCFIVFYKGLDNSNIYKPELDKKIISNFIAKDFYTENLINSEEIFIDKNLYLLNIWASWCLPCKKEHPILMELSKNKSISIIGINYRDKKNNAKKFINELGNPYSYILDDKEGSLSVELGAYGVPETLVIDENKMIIKKIVGPIEQKLLNEIILNLK